MTCRPILEDTPQMVLTFHPRFRRYAWREMLAVDPSAVVAAPLDADSLLVATVLGPQAQKALSESRPVFVQHVAPAQVSLPLGWTRDDLACLIEASELCPPLENGRSFAVQCRVGRRPPSVDKQDSYSSKDVEVRVGSHFEAKGFRPEFVRPEQVISIYLAQERGYVGTSDVRLNLNVQADEHRRFSGKPTAVSRAEYKLQEAIEVFGLKGRLEGRAIDAGASPGGWTKVLADHGMQVAAVDPGALHPSVLANPRVEHFKARLEEASFAEGTFDLAVNDMNMDPGESSQLMCRIARWLKPGAPSVMTIKLPNRNMLGAINHASQVLRAEYEVEAIRHLFHNRQEVTALLRRSPEG